MGMNQRCKDTAVVFEGQKSGLPIEVTTIKDGTYIQNFVLKQGQLVKINGGTTYAEILEAEPGGILALTRFKDLLVAQRYTSIACENTEESATFTTITASLASPNRMQFSSWRDRLYMVNQVEAKFLLNRSNHALASDYKYGNLGLDPPQFTTLAFEAFSEDVNFDSGGVPDGTYGYFITFFDNETNSESPAIGAKIGTNGIFELSANGYMYFSPVPLQVVVSGGPSNVVFNFVRVAAYLNEQLLVNPRITHFALYRSLATVATTDTRGDGFTYSTPFRVNNTNNLDPTGLCVFNIQKFLAEGFEFVDSGTTDTTISLPENNSPPPTTERLKVVFEEFKDLGFLTGDFPASTNLGFRHTKIFRDQLFGVGAMSPGNSFSPISLVPSLPDGLFDEINSFSDILQGSEVYQPDYFPYLWEVGRGDGQTTVGLGVLGDNALLVFKEKSTYYLSGSSPDNYVLRILDTRKGCINEGTIQETPAGVICLDRAGLVLFNKVGQGQLLTEEIQDVIDSILFQYSSLFYSFYDPKDVRYYCAVIIPGSTTPNLTICIDLKSMNITLVQGTEGLSRVMDTDSNGEFVDTMGSLYNGRLVNYSDAAIVLNQGEVIESIWTSGNINFGDDQHKKKVQWLYIRAKSNDSWTVDIEIIPDYDESRRFTILAWNVAASQSEWYSSDLAADGSLIWDEGNWAYEGLVRSVSKVPIKSIGYTFQIRIINKESDPQKFGFTIESISIEGSVLGR